MTLRATLLLAVSAVAFAACDADAPDGLGGRYDLTLYEDDRPVAEGRIDVAVGPQYIFPAIVEGSWRLDRVGDAFVTSGRGAVRGSYGEGVRLSLLVGDPDAPDLDAGVGLDGVVEGDRIVGEWGEGMSAGPRGRFEARR